MIQLLDGRDIKDIILVDNKVLSYAIHFTNGIPIKDYEGDKGDCELKLLTTYLMSFLNEEDVRKKIKKDFKLENGLFSLFKVREQTRSYR